MAWESKKFTEHQAKSHKDKRDAKARGIAQAEARKNPKRGENTAEAKKKP